MKKVFAFALAVIMMIGGAFALSSCSKGGNNTKGAENTTAEQTTSAEPKEAKISSSEIYVTYDTSIFNYDEELTELFSKDETAYIYAKGLDESNLSARGESFDALQNNEKLKSVYYSEMQVGDNTAKTATYTDGKSFYKRYFIELASPSGTLLGVEIQACLGVDKSTEYDIDDVVSTLVVK